MGLEKEVLKRSYDDTYKGRASSENFTGVTSALGFAGIVCLLGNMNYAAGVVLSGAFAVALVDVYYCFRKKSKEKFKSRVGLKKI